MTEEGLLALIVVTVPLALFYAYAVVDVVKRKLAVTRKLAWIIAMVLIPGIGVLAYYMARPLSPPGRESETGVADAVEALNAAWESGELDDAGYRRAKLQLFRV